MKKTDQLLLVLSIQQFSALKAKLSEKFYLNEQSPIPCQRIFFDSFDWRLYQKNIICFYEKEQLHLHDFTDSPVTQPLSLYDKPPHFWQELPESALQEKLAELLQIRALLPQVEFSGTLSTLDLHKEQEDKSFIRAQIIETGTDVLVELQAHTCHQKQFRKRIRQLKKLGKPCAFPLRQQLEFALKNAGRSMAECEPFTLPVLEPEMASLKAAKLICYSLLMVMQRNLQGVIDDIDSEFLHDFRVAVRRTRSLLALLKDRLEPDIRDRFRADFRDLGRITGPVRDLDVQLLSTKECHAQLPQSLHKGLHSFFAVLRERRTNEQDKLKKELAAPEYQRLLQDWQEYLEQESSETGKTIGQTAQRIIQKQFAKMLRAIQALNNQSPDKELHQVRIQGKKLRYALEFFRSLYPSKEIERLIRTLKQLQDDLGFWNDLSVQEKTLAGELNKIVPNTEETVSIAAAIGALLGDVERKRQLAREGLEAAFQQFTGKKNIHHWQQLFGAKVK